MQPVTRRASHAASERVSVVAWQEVVSNLMISAIEFRSEDDPELAAHTHAKRIEMRTVSPSREVRLHTVLRARLPKEPSRA